MPLLPVPPPLPDYQPLQVVHFKLRDHLELLVGDEPFAQYALHESQSFLLIGERATNLGAHWVINPARAVVKFDGNNLHIEHHNGSLLDHNWHNTPEQLHLEVIGVKELQ